MNNDIYTVTEIKSMLDPIFDRYNIKKAVLFGSYSKGSATKNSDIDLLVDSSLRGLRFVGFMEEIRRAVNKDVDILDVTHIITPSPIADEILGSGVVIYEK